MKTIGILIILTLSSLAYSSTDSTFIYFDQLESLKDFGGKKLFFRINNKFLTPDKNPHKIKINEVGFDTIYFSFDSLFTSPQVSLAKLRSKENYVIRISPCSGYELVPLIKRKRIGQIRFKSINVTDSLIAVSSPSMTFKKVPPNSSTDYMVNVTSDFCEYASVRIYFAKPDSKNGIPDDSEFILSGINFHFMLGEKVTAIFDGNTNEIKLIIDGRAK